MRALITTLFHPAARRPLGVLGGVLVAAALVTTPARGAPSSSPTGVRVAGIVLKWIPGDREANYRRAERLIREAAENGAGIVVTAEAFLDGYAVRNERLAEGELRELAEPIPGGPYFGRLQRLAADLDVYLVAALSEREGSRVYNSSVLIGPDGQLVGTYRKHFLWSEEDHLYSPGTSFPTFETPYGTIGMMICFDRQHPAAVKGLVGNGADLVFAPSGGGYGPQSVATMQQRSREGHVPIVFVHPVEFLVTGPDGSVLVDELDGVTLDDPDGHDPGTVFYYDLALDRH